ncbi:hypothetical protein BWQ96_06907 [Gracilariopsis chorda]|uniref:TOG domain-containing protein n=1 Tax=Gracilariopsis chorda TaxID=448386 RepID=A0A2V3IMN4_9FLOR|nr:hypothetical protein BWQ96_06907 [Gracilariopsis chorda]|eukprot:PXF43344.1 hypothetical protein BWQ96_06907 [Gracilariopsis chorda]
MSITAPPDTPARARAANRPRTRHWQRLLSEADLNQTNISATRKVLRNHLAAADRLQKRRAQLSHRRHIRNLTDPTSEWTARRSALVALANTTDPEIIRLIAPCLGTQLNDLRSMLVVAASECIIRVADKLLLEESIALFKDALRASHATKKVLHDARRDAALAIAACQTDQHFWQSLVEQLNNPHPVPRTILLHACTSLVKNASDQQENHLNVAKDTTLQILQRATTDRIAQVRDAAKTLFQAYATRFGTEQAKTLLEQLDKSAQTRLNSVLQTDRKKPDKPQRISMKEQILKAKREALRKQRQAAVPTDPFDCAQSVLLNQIASNDQENLENHA